MPCALQLQPCAPESALSYNHLSHSVSSHLDSSPESSEMGADVPLSRKGKRLRPNRHPAPEIRGKGSTEEI